MTEPDQNTHWIVSFSQNKVIGLTLFVHVYSGVRVQDQFCIFNMLLTFPIVGVSISKNPVCFTKY